MIWLAVLLVLLRLPAINRPVSKHHEFNTAVILINAESWATAGGPQQFSYTPLLNYQGAANHVFEKGAHIDVRGNHVYLSFGAGWYLLPWFFWSETGIAFTPVSLRLLNIFIGLITVLLLYQLVIQITRNRNAAFAAAVIFSLMPAPLWYTGIGYITTAIMLPLVITVVMLWHQFESNANNITLFRLVAMLLLSICLGYCDWISVFLFGLMALWSMVRAVKAPRYLWVTAMSIVAVVYPVFLVLMQFADYLGWEQVLNYWKLRFTDRSATLEQGSWWFSFQSLAVNLLSGYLPLGILCIVYFRHRKKAALNTKVKWPIWALVSLIFYNGIFFNWSVLHQFAWMAFALFATIFFAVYFFPALPEKTLRRLTSAMAIISIVMYFVVNPPGGKSLSGQAYNTQEKAGRWIQLHIDHQLPIFIIGNTDKVIEYYAKRTFTTVPSLDEARKTAQAFGLPQAVLLEFDNSRVKKATFFKAK